jgi:hypothetical protein
MISMQQHIDLDENATRHIILNVIRSVRRKFYKQYGEVVICIDDKNYWRKQIFPHYKAARKAARKQSTIDWNRLFEIINLIHQEIKEFFPYKVIQVAHAEADDIIGAICTRIPGPHIIISNDKDFMQLQRLPGIAIYSPRLSSQMKCDNPALFLAEHIIRGDLGDGIPNVLSDDDTFVNPDKRQKRLTDAKVNEWVMSVPENVFSPEVMQNYHRNESLISLFKIPEDIVEEVQKCYIDNSTITGGRGMRLMKYFMDKGLRNLVENLEEF